MAASAASLNIVNSYYRAILRTTPSASLAEVFATQLDAGTLTSNQLEGELLSSAQSSTIPAILTYDVFYNATPATTGVDFLTNYANALQAGAYTYNSAGVFQLTPGQTTGIPFSLQNVYVNLGATFAGDPNSTFNATYGSLGAAAFVNQIYTQIFGVAPAASTQQFLISNLPYYTSYAGSAIGGYGAIAGLLLSVAEASGAGQYPAAASAFLGAAAISAAAGSDTAQYGMELIAAYGNPTSSVVSLTTAVDNVTGNTILADLTPFLFNGIGPTLNVGDRITGSAGLTNNTFDINDQFGTGTDVIPAGVFISNVQNINLTTQGNAGGQSPITQVGVGTASGVFDVTSTAATQASTISGVKAVNILSAGANVDNVRVDPGTVNPVNVTVTHQHVNGTGGVAILGGNNITVSDGDGTAANAAALNAGILGVAVPVVAGVPNAGVTIGSATVVNTNNINLNPLGAVKVNEIGNNQIIVNGGTTVTVQDSGGGFIQVGQPTGSQLSYPSDEPVGAVTVTDNADTQAGPILVFGAAPDSTNKLNSTTATINETAQLASAVFIGAVNTIGGINNSYSPAGNDSVTVTAQIPVNYDFVGGVQSGTTAVGLTAITIIGGATDAVTTNANSVVVGNALLATQFNGLTPVANENASGTVNVADTAVVGKGAVGASVTVEGGTDVTIANAGGAVTIGTPRPDKNTTITNSGTQTVTDTAPLVYDNVINTGFARNVTTVGGTTVNITTNAGAVTVGTAAGVPGSEPSGAVTVADSASPGVNVTTPKIPSTAGTITTLGGAGSTFTLTVGATTYTYIVTGAGAPTETPATVAANLALQALADPNATVTAVGSTIFVVDHLLAGPPVALGTIGGVITPAAATDVPITIFGGTNVTANSANGSITVGAGTKASNPTGNVTATTSGIETGGQFGSTTTVNGGVNVAINTTGAGGAVVAGVKATPISGTVAIKDTFSGTQNADSFTVVGGVGSSAVSITTTKSSGPITVGGVASVLNTAGTALINSNVFANGNVTIVNETPANTGVAGAANLWGTGATTVNAVGATTVTVAGGAGAAITDEQTTPATGGPGAGNAVGPSTLATVSLDHAGVGGSTSTITSDALTSLTVLDDTAGDNYTVVETPAHALGLTIGNDAGANAITGAKKTTTVTDASASAVNVTDNGKATAGILKVVAAKATSASFTTTTALTADLTGDTNLTSLTLANTAALNLGDLSFSPNVVVTAGSGSTGGVTITNLNGATSSFKGGGSTGNDSITLTNNLVKNTIQAGGGTTNTIIANYAAGAGDVALSSAVGGFNILGVGPLARSSNARQDTITVATIGAVGALFTINVSSVTTAAGATTGGTSFTYTQVAGDTTATVAAALVNGLNAKLSAIGEPVFAALSAPGSNKIFVTGQSGATTPGGVALTTVAAPPGSVTDSATGGAATTSNAYDATGFNSLNVGAIAGSVAFKNVGNAETLTVSANPGAGNSITLLPTAATNSLSIVMGKDGPATGVTAGTAGLGTAPAPVSVVTVNTANINVASLGNGTTTNFLTLQDRALVGIGVFGDESLTIAVPAIDAAFGLASTDSAFSAVTSVNASQTSISTQPSAKNVTDASGVVVSAAGVTVLGGASQIKAQGAQGLDFVVQSDTVTLTGHNFLPGDVITETITPTFGYYNNAGLTFGAIPVPNRTPIVATYTVQATDIGLTTIITDQNVAAQLAGVINTVGVGFISASPSNTTGAPPVPAALLVITGSDNAQNFNDVNSLALPIAAPTFNPGVVYTQARDSFTAGTGGSTFTLGTGGGYNPFALQTITSGTPPVSTVYQGLFDTGFERVDLTGSTAAVDTVVVGPNTIATFGASGAATNGGVSGFSQTPSTTADTLGYNTVNTPYTVLANITSGKQLDLTVGSAASNIANALDPSNALANALANINYSSIDGLLTIVGNGTSQQPTGTTMLDAAEIIVAMAASPLVGGQGAIAAVSDGQGGTYIVAAAGGNNFVNLKQSVVTGGALNTTAGTFNPANTGLSVVQLRNNATFAGFGSSQTNAIAATDGVSAQGGLTAGLGAQGAVLANVTNNLASTSGTPNTGLAGSTKVYDDTGFSLDALTADTTVSTAYNNLAPAAQLNIADAGGTVGAVSVTQIGSSGNNSLIVDFQAPDTVQSLTTSGDWALRLVADANSVLKSLTDSTGLVTTLQITGNKNLEVDAVSMAGLTTVDATKDLGIMTFGLPAAPGVTAVPVNVAGLKINGAPGGDIITVSGANNAIKVGTSTVAILGNVTVTATGNGDTVTLINSATINNLNVGGTGDTISVDTGTNNISGGAVIGSTAANPLGLQVPLQSGDTVNLADGGTDAVWVGGNSTVNLTGNTGTTTFGGPAAATTAFNKGAIASTAAIQVTGDTVGTTTGAASAAFTSTGTTSTGPMTIITGADLAGGTPLSLTFLNAAAAGGAQTEALAGGSAASAFVNVQAATSLSAALDTDVNQSLTLDAQTTPGAHTNVFAGALALNAKTGIISWFQFSGNTYVVEAANTTASAAAHVGLQASDTVVQLTGLVDLSGASFGAGPLSHTLINV